ncbi:DUF2171 domain-containing protein [Ciceribacter sp. L1K22]|uniref:DUF2171 domain-containing protein n=1 Tax=Ciceribacter sp. L1K22 TaxID=2820275 RepID=UPI001ABDA46A|nr:DUF2171 domain-containing protein [Ciceribacter sp. L1K22]MBO3762544.1 DUF2171 domain-containing protein [Ciceribacter sp. L1K22]
MLSAERIRIRMKVVGADGLPVGTVDRIEGDNRIRLMRADSPDDRDHAIPVNWVDHVDEHIHLSLTAGEAQQRWETVL